MRTTDSPSSRAVAQWGSYIGRAMGHTAIPNFEMKRAARRGRKHTEMKGRTCKDKWERPTTGERVGDE